nr:hypothetical protein [Crucivirus sp.]
MVRKFTMCPGCNITHNASWCPYKIRNPIVNIGFNRTTPQKHWIQNKQIPRKTKFIQSGFNRPYQAWPTKRGIQKGFTKKPRPGVVWPQYVWNTQDWSHYNPWNPEAITGYKERRISKMKQDLANIKLKEKKLIHTLKRKYLPKKPVNLFKNWGKGNRCSECGNTKNYCNC